MGFDVEGLTPGWMISEAPGDQVTGRADRVCFAMTKSVIPKRWKVQSAATRKGYCGAIKRNGEPCRRPAGDGTVHKGVGQCQYHGGQMTERKLDAVAPAMLERLAGYDIGYVDPLEALLMCVRVSAAEVSFFTEKVLELAPEAITERPSRQQVAGAVDPQVFDLKGEEQLNIWIRERQRSVDRLARFSKMALDAGVAERQVRIAEQMGDMIARILDGVLTDLQLTASQREESPEIIRRHLALLTAGGRAA